MSEVVKEEKTAKKKWLFRVGLVIFLAGLFLLGNGLGIYRWPNNLSSAVADYVPYPAVIVNSRIISVAEYEENLGIINRFYSSQIGQSDDYTYNEQEIKQETLNILVENEIIAQAAKKYQVVVSEEEVQKQYQQIAQQVGSVEELEQEIKTVYGISSETFLNKSLRPNLIFTKLHERYLTDESIDRERKEPNQKVAEEANAVLARIKQGENFSDLAREYSADTYSAEQGGDLGYFGRGEMEPEFEQAAFALDKGAVSDLVHTRYGYHLIQVDDRRTTEENGEQVAAHHILFMTDDFFDVWLTDLKRGSRVHVLLPNFSWQEGEIRIK